MSTVNKESQKQNYFSAKIYAMYDGKEFRSFDFCIAETEDQATKEFNRRAANGDYSFEEIEHDDDHGYWSDCDAHVCFVEKVKQISEKTYQEMSNF